MSQPSSLYRLQALDLQLDQFEERLVEIHRILEDSTAVREMEALLEKAEGEYKKAHSALTIAEHEVLAQRQKIENTDTKLYGGSVTNPKELEDYQREAESLRTYLATLEDRLLEAMLKLESVEEKRDSIQDQLDQLREQQRQQHSELAEEREDIRRRVENLREQRSAAASGIGQAELAKYERLREQHNGVAVALLDEGNCTACGLQVAASTKQSVRSGTDLVTCSQCGRILYAG